MRSCQGYTTCLLFVGLWRNNGLVEGRGVVVKEGLEVICESVNVDVKRFNGWFPIVKSSERGMEWEIFPLDVDDGV